MFLYSLLSGLYLRFLLPLWLNHNIQQQNSFGYRKDAAMKPTPRFIRFKKIALMTLVGLMLEMIASASLVADSDHEGIEPSQDVALVFDC